MASIKGIEVKNLKSFRGVEYPTNYQGTVYFNGQKMGFWSQDSWGGPDHYEFNTKELDEKAKEYYGADSIYDLDCLMGEILSLAQYEKDYKKAIKEGYTALIVISDDYRETVVRGRFAHNTDKDTIIKKCADVIESFTRGSSNKKGVKTTVFTDLVDFAQ